MDWLGFNSGNSGILESTREYLGITRGSYGNDSGMTQEYLGDSGRVWDMTPAQNQFHAKSDIIPECVNFHLHLISGIPQHKRDR